MKNIYLAVKHDRHTDDIYEAFSNHDDAMEKCREWASSYPKERYTFTEDQQGFFCSEDYNMFVVMVKYH